MVSKAKTRAADKVSASRAHATQLRNKTSKKSSKKPSAQEIEIKASKDGTSNVLYIGHLPHGFFERQMREFFSQFGRVENVRLSRSKKTAKSKGYAFLQFQSVEVASIAAEAMDGYHMFGQKLVVKTLKASDVHPETFNGANRVFKRIPWREIEAKRHNKDRTEEEEKKRAARGRRSAKRRAERIAAAGIDYVFGGTEDEVPETKAKVAKTTKVAAKTTMVAAKTTKVAAKTTKVAAKTTKVAAKTKAAKKAIDTKTPAKTPATKITPKTVTKQTSSKKASPAVTRARAAKKKA